MESFEGDEKFNLNASFSQDLVQTLRLMICNGRVQAIVMMKSQCDEWLESYPTFKVGEEWRKVGYVLVVNKAVFTVLGKWD